MTSNRISLLTFPHSSAVCKNDTMKLFNQPPVVLSYWPRHCCGIRPRLWAVSIVSNKKKLEKFNFFQVGSNCSHSTNISIWHFCHVLVSFGTFWWLSVKFIANIPWVVPTVGLRSMLNIENITLVTGLIQIVTNRIGLWFKCISFFQNHFIKDCR